MNRSRLQKRIFTGMAGCLVLAVAVVVAQAQGTAEERSDSKIEMDVVHALDAAPQLKNDLITAATIQREVTLSGTVATGEERKLAESIVAKVDGVSRVHNNLKVGDPNAQNDPQNSQPVDDPMYDRNTAGQQDQGPALPPDYSYPQPSPNQQGQRNPYPQPDANGQNQSSYGQYPQPTYPQPGYPPQGQYPPNSAPYGGAPYGQPYGYGQRPAPLHLASRPTTIPVGTLLVLRTSEMVESRRAREGETIQFVVIEDVMVNGLVAVPRGAMAHGVISGVHNTERGDVAGSSVIGVRLVSLEMGGISYPITSDEFKAIGPGKGSRTANAGITGALLGAVIGGIAGGGKGAAIGAGAGAGAGVAAGAATKGPDAWIPAEARLDFHLQDPVTVNPISPEEATRLSQGLFPAGARLVRRPVYPYSYTVYGSYPRPMVQYRPYVMMGGYYHW